MSFHFSKQPSALLMAAALLSPMGAAPAWADKPAWSGKGGKEDRSERREDRRSQERDRDDDSRRERDDRSGKKHGHFEERHQVMVRDYYAVQYRDGRCPPGLRKKHNGCMPPGQVKKWHMGQPLPSHVIYYAVPPQLAMQIGPAPGGYRYVRVATDILMIAIGTGIVMDAIADLGR